MFRYVITITVQNYLRSVYNSARLPTEFAEFLLVPSADCTIHCKRSSLVCDFGDRPCPSAPSHNIRGTKRRERPVTSETRPVDQA